MVTDLEPHGYRPTATSPNLLSNNNEDVIKMLASIFTLLFCFLNLPKTWARKRGVSCLESSRELNAKYFLSSKEKCYSLGFQ